MKKTELKYIFFAAAIFLFLAPGAFAAPDPSPYEPQIVTAFADSLYEEGFLNQAEGEYKRFLFSADTSVPEVQTSFLSLCNIYKTHHDKNGINWLNTNFYNFAQTPVREKINILRADFIFQERNAAEFGKFRSEVAKEEDLFSPDFSDLIKVSGLLLDNNIPDFKFYVSLFAEQSSNYEKLNELCSGYKTKSPGLALFLSMILPGAGKWYTGSFGAFASSFLSIGSFVAGTVISGIQTEWKSWQPYVFGVCGAVLYISEIYGAYKSAQRYNDALFRALCEETESIYEKIY